MFDNLAIDFIGKRKKFFIASAIMIVLTLLATVVLGVSLDIEFKGGAIINYTYEGDISAEEFAGVIEQTIGGEVTVQESLDAITGDNKFSVSLSGDDALSVDNQQQLAAALEEKYEGNNLSLLDSNSVAPTLGREFLMKCLIAIGFGSLVMVIYVAFRFRKMGGWSAGVMAVVALIHDLIVVYFAFVLFGYPINDNFIAVCLTIIGYSLNDTIVIYDRIRENNRLYSRKLSVAGVVNKSINQSFSRSMNTSVTTVMIMIVVAVISVIFGISSIISFAVPLIFGLISGFYSSIFISAPLWVTWKEYKGKKNAKKPRKSGKKSKK